MNMPRKNVRRAASKEALKQMQLLSATNAFDEDDDTTETYEIASDDDVVDVDIDEMPPKKKYKLSHRKSSDGHDRDVIVLKTIDALNNTESVDDLLLEAWAEDLSPAQLALRNRVTLELQELSTRIQKITKDPNVEVIYQGETCSAFERDGAAPLIPASTSTNTKTRNASKSQAKNLHLQPSANNAQNSYQLVMDPRLGLIVGTMTPATEAAAPIKPKTTNATPATSTDTRPVRRRGRNSVRQYSSLQGPPPLMKIDKPTAPSIQVRAPETIRSSNVVDLTGDDNRVLADSREISFNKIQGKTYPSLVVVARAHLAVKDITGGDRTKLDGKVKTVLMYVPTKFTEWLIQQGMIRSEQACINHSSRLKLGMYSDVTKFPYSGGYVWISECCPHRFVSVFSGSLFEAAPHPPSTLLKLIYHWSCQTNIQNVTTWVKVDNAYVKGMYTWLRAICTVALYTHVGPIGGPGVRIEVGVISLGTTSSDGKERKVKVEVLGLLEPKAKRIRLRAIEPLADGDCDYKKRFAKILEPLIQWVHPDSVIVTDLTVDKNTLNNMGFKFVQQAPPTGPRTSNQTIMEYLRRIVPRMFQNTLSLFTREIIQQFLDELVWREWFGTTTVECFDNLIIHISEQTRCDVNSNHSLIARLNKVAANPFKNWSISTNMQPIGIVKGDTTAPSKRSVRQRKIINIRPTAPSPDIQQQQQRPPRQISPDIPEQMVPLENYYYGCIDGTVDRTKISYTIKCSMCKLHFNNNIKLMTHLFSHAHTILTGVNQCRYCLSSVGTQDGLNKHILTSHPLETRFGDSYICIICENRFANPFLLGKHLSKEHVPSELPYQCGTCGHRCSSHRQSVDHFYKAHDNATSIQCPFCLKSTSLWNNGRVMPQNLSYFMQHLQKHSKKAMAKKCTKCALWFINKDTLKDHQQNMHTTQRRKPGLIPWNAPRNGLMVPKSKQDKQIWEDTEREFSFSNLTVDAPNKMICKECKASVNTPNHFQALESCTNRNCQYLTCCKKAMDLHNDICKSLNASLPHHTLREKMHCICGYRDDDGNLLAKHLAECERKSAYPSAEAAKRAIKAHSMLDVLGLVRRPEEPTSSKTKKRKPTSDVSHVVSSVSLNPKRTKLLDSLTKHKKVTEEDEIESKNHKVEKVKENEVEEVHDSDVEEIKESDIEEVKDSDAEEVDESVVKKIKVNEVGEVKESGVEVEDNEVEKVKEDEGDDLKESEAEEVDKSEVGQAKETKVEEEKENEDEEVKESEVEKVKESEVGEVKESKVVEEDTESEVDEKVKENDPDEIKENDPDEIKDDSEEVKERDVEEVNVNESQEDVEEMDELKLSTEEEESPTLVKNEDASSEEDKSEETQDGDPVASTNVDEILQTIEAQSEKINNEDSYSLAENIEDFLENTNKDLDVTKSDAALQAIFEDSEQKADLSEVDFELEETVNTISADVQDSTMESDGATISDKNSIEDEDNVTNINFEAIAALIETDK